MSHQSAKITPYDAWLIARLRFGRDHNGEIRRASQPIRPLIERMSQATPEEWEGIWEEHLTTLSEDESSALIDAVAEANPSGPAPEDDGWGQPLAFKMSPVEPYPLDIYPAPVQHLIRHGARSIGCPPDFLALPVLTVAGAAIGRSASLRLKSSYFASACIYAACAGLPGDGKSPAVGAVTRPMRQIDEALFAEWKEEKATFEALNAEFEAASKAAKKVRPKYEDDDFDDEGFEPEPHPFPTKPPQPVLRRTVVSDITIEALDTIMEQNPRGLLQVLDEASSLMTSMNQYRGGKGSDRQWYMTTWSGEARTVDRKGNADKIPIRIPHPFLSFIGGIVPDMIGSFCDERGRHDGFLDRFLFAYPDPVPKTGWREEGIPDEVATKWSEIVGRLQALPMRVENLQAVPNVVNLSIDGKVAWREMIDAHHAEQSAAGFPPSLSGPWAKLEQYAGRIILVLHLLELAADPSRDLSALPDVSAKTVRNAARLLSYLKRHTRRVHEAMRSRARGEEGSEEAQCILKWIYRHKPESFTCRDLTRDLSATFSKRPKALEDALGWLAKQECIRLQPEPERPAGRRGRPRSATYLVNPHLLLSQQSQVYDPGATSAAGGDYSDDSGDSATELTDLTGEEDGNGLLPF